MEREKPENSNNNGHNALHLGKNSSEAPLLAVTRKIRKILLRHPVFYGETVLNTILREQKSGPDLPGFSNRMD